MPRMPDPLSLLSRLLEGLGHLIGRRERRRHDGGWSAPVRHRNRPRSASRPWGHRGGDRPGPGLDGGGIGNGFGHPRLRRRSRGSALVQALMAALIAVIGAMLLASRLFSSRFNSFSRSDTLAAREAAEYGLNALQAQLNSDLHGYLWVTRRNNWNTVTLNALSTCQVPVLDASGNPVSTLPALPGGVNSPQTISTDADATITYQLTGFEPPTLPDTQTSTQEQAEFCGENQGSTAANFGNLNGGSALITVTGTVTRGNSRTEFRLSRRPHVASPASQLAFSFIILGNAYQTTTETFGAATDITQLLSANGNICYGKASDTTCFTTPARPKTIIGCFDLGSCLINNVDLDNRTRSAYCADVKAKKQKKRGFTCNEFQQIGDLPPIPTPDRTGMIISSSFYADSDWTAYSAEYDCEGKDYDPKDYADLKQKTPEWKCKAKGGYLGSKEITIERVRFPYKDYTKLPANMGAAFQLTNADLMPGCYFSGVDAASQTSKASPSSTRFINCLVRKMKLDNKGKIENFISYTANGASQLIRVNMYLHGPDEIKLDKGGIQGNDTSTLGWNRMQILGKPVATADGSPVACNQSSRIVSKKGNDLNNLFLWLPNASLIYDRKASLDSSYAVIWVCKFTGPVKDGANKYSIITPFPEDVARAGLIDTLGPSFVQTLGGTYRGYGSEDTPTS